MYIADLHIHSKYSRATSRDCDAPNLDLWARYKGIGLIGTGDFTHPGWRRELNDALIPAEEGLYILKDSMKLPGRVAYQEDAPRFVVTGEISSIYKKNGKTRKVHNVIILPGLEQAETLSQRLEAIGNIRSDGRPILGIDCRDLLEITLDVCPDAVFIPAHIWTPHFSLFGAFSGFDTIEECFEDLTPYVNALETGLSSDPQMNWRISSLDRFTLVSNSDAHSPSKLGREANIIDAGLSYTELAKAIQTGKGFGGTLEFFPEEGKYHLDGHRVCRQRLEPYETLNNNCKCPVCGKKITIGVLHRVEELADRPDGFIPKNAKPFESLIPLTEVIAASTGISSSAKGTKQKYFEMISELGSEFHILRSAAIEDIARAAGPCIAEGIRRIRAGMVERIAGYDGEYGTIVLFDKSELETLNGQMSMFGASTAKSGGKKSRAAAREKDGRRGESASVEKKTDGVVHLNSEQMETVTADEPVIAVIAGPGSGKTKTLVERIRYLIQERGVSPSEITAVTFTNNAAAELKERLLTILGGKREIRGLTIGTFHSICIKLLDGLPVVGEGEALMLIDEILRDNGIKESAHKYLRSISSIKNGCNRERTEQEMFVYGEYCSLLKNIGARDLDDLLIDALSVDVRKKRCFNYLLVDEFQDINPAQNQLLRHWSEKSKGLFVIGDPDQSIYGFRGANSRCFDDMKESNKSLKTFYLRRNYRSTGEIIKNALSVISHNPGGKRILYADGPDGEPVTLISAESPFSEAVWIAKEISVMAGGVDMLDAQSVGNDRSAARPFSDMAVLCRTRRQLELIESCLRHDSIPCIISGREDYLNSDTVQGVIGFFRSMLDTRDVLSLRRCLRIIWKCPADLIERAERVYVNMEQPDYTLLRDELGQFGNLAQWIDGIECFLPRILKDKPRKLLEYWTEKYGIDDNLERLLNAAVFHNDMPSFTNALVLGQEEDIRRASGKCYSSGAVRLMTLHGAKGLEFPVVFLAGMSGGTLPLERQGFDTDFEEERRLLFVGMTRAREELIITSSGQASVFAAELDASAVRKTARNLNRKPSMRQLSMF